MWISNRRHVYRVCGIILHPTGVFSNMLMQNKRYENRKTSDWSNIYCSVHGRYRQRYLRLRVFNNFVINVDLTRFNKIATQGAPQMAVDKEANSLSRVYSYYSKFNLRLFYG